MGCNPTFDHWRLGLCLRLAFAILAFNISSFTSKSRDQGFPRGGKEHPSRNQASQQVRVIMGTYHKRVGPFEAAPSHTKLILNGYTAEAPHGTITASPRRPKTERNTMKLKITFGQTTHFGVPILQNIRSWTQLLFGTRHSLHSLAMAEPPMAGSHGMSACVSRQVFVVAKNRRRGARGKQRPCAGGI